MSIDMIWNLIPCQVKQSKCIVIINYQNSTPLGTNNISFLYFIFFLLQPSIHQWHYTSKPRHDTKIVSSSLSSFNLQSITGTIHETSVRYQTVQLKTETSTWHEILNLEYGCDIYNSQDIRDLAYKNKNLKENFG